MGLRNRIIGAMIIAAMLIPIRVVEANTWHSEDSGQASLTVEWGSPYVTVAEYTTHTLKLGERCIAYASATAQGTMYVYGLAATTGPVKVYLYWYQKGQLAGGGAWPGTYNMWIHIKFQAIEISSGALVEKVVLDEHGPWGDEGTWHMDDMDLWLQQGQWYKFVLSAEVHADAVGLGSAIADFGGIWWSDSRIEWGYIDVPNTVPNQPPSTTSTPSGPTLGRAYRTYTYSTSTTDPEGDSIRYQFDWDDGTKTWTEWHSSGSTASASHYWTSIGNFSVKVRAQDSREANSDWSSSLEVTMLSAGGGGCPYVSTWNGSRYMLDNNLLPAAEHSNGIDVTDDYVLQKNLMKREDGSYSLLLSEFESDHDFFDKVQLIAVDHPSNVNIAVSSYAEILTYTNPFPPVSAIDEKNQNVKDLLHSIDGNYYEGHNGSYVTLNFGDIDVSQGAKLVLKADSYKTSIYVQVQDSKNNWNTVATVIPRLFWATEIINMSEYLPDARGNLKVRLCFTANHKLDFVGLDTSPQTNIEAHQCQLLTATHSEKGYVTDLLLNSDQTYAELMPGEQIELSFSSPQQTMEKRDFIIVTEGHYYLNKGQ